MLSLIAYIFLTAKRDLLFIGVFLIMLLSISLAFLLGGTALVEPLEMTIAYIAASQRLLVLIGITIFICFHVHRGFETKEFEFMMARPLSRMRFITGYWIGVFLLGLLLISPLFPLLYFLCKHSQGVLIWITSLICEVAMMTAFALLGALMLRSAVTAVLGSLCFYLLSRMMGFFILLMHHQPPSGQGWMHLMNMGLYHLLQFCSLLMPRLDFFGKTSWLLYEVSQTDWKLFLLQTAVYVPFLLMISFYDFHRKQF